MPDPLGLPPTLQRLVTATNAHDLDGLVACFADDYRLVMPNHPSRNFTGPGQVRRNWEQFFALIPDITGSITAAAAGPAEDQWWTEWQMSGTRLDGTSHLMGGVTDRCPRRPQRGRPGPGQPVLPGTPRRPRVAGRRRRRRRRAYARGHRSGRGGGTVIT